MPRVDEANTFLSWTFINVFLCVSGVLLGAFCDLYRSPWSDHVLVKNNKNRVCYIEGQGQARRERAK